MRISFVFTMASAIFLTSCLIYLHTYTCYGQQNFFNHQNFKKQHGISGSPANKPICTNNLTDGKPQLQMLNSQIQAENFEPMQPMTQVQPSIQPINQNTQAFPVNFNRAGAAAVSLDAQPQALPNYAPQVSRPTQFQQPQQFTIQQRPVTPAQPTPQYNPPIQNYWPPAVPVVMETPLPPLARPYSIFGYDGLRNDALQVPYPQYIPLQHPGYPISTVITDQGSQSSSLKTLLPIILNLLKEKNNCPCRSCECNCSKSTGGYCKRKYPLSEDGPEIEPLSEEMETIRNVREPKKDGKLKSVTPDSAEDGESSEHHEEHEEE